MFYKLFIVFLVLLPIIDGRHCSRCTCTTEKAQVRKIENALSQSKHENHMIKSQKINLGNYFALSISTSEGKQIGFIHDVFELSMSIPPNSEIHIQPRFQKINKNQKFVHLFYDINHKGLFIELPIPGNYTASQISLPKWSASSIIIPEGYQAILYTHDDFRGDFIVLTSSQTDFGKFNDKMVSMQINKVFEQKPEYVAIIHSHQNYNGKKIGLTIGESLKIESSKIQSILISPGNEVFVYEKNILIDVHSMSIPSYPKQPQFIATIQVHPINGKQTEYAVFYDDIDYIGPHFTVLNYPVTYNQTNGKLSSMKIPMNHEVVLYEKENMQGVHIILSGHIPNLNIYLFNDRAMTIVYREKQTETVQYAEIYTKPNFYGQKRIIPMGYTIIQEEIYVGSIKVPSGLFVSIKKLPIYPLNLERQYMYISDCDDSRYFVDTPLISINVGKF
jgi:sporulation protein YlmC with PRC-barrel domain